MRDAVVAEITQLAAKSSDVIVVTGDLGFGVLTEFAERFPDQFINAGVAEQNMTALACGMALEGCKVFTYSIANFSTLRCLEQIRNDVCYHDADVTVISSGGGFSYGQLGVSHFATEDLAIMRSIPNLSVVAPSDPWESAVLLRQMAAAPGPKYLRLDKSKAGLPAKPDDVHLGRSRRVRDGGDVTFFAVGGILREAMAAADALAGAGIESRVVAVHSLSPFDPDEVISAARETGGIVCVEEHRIVGGLGSAVAQACLTSGVIPKFFRQIGLGEGFPSIVGDQDYLRAAYQIDAKAIERVATEALRGNGG
jgi:transketolase